MHHLTIQCSNTEMPKVTHGYQGLLGRAAHALSTGPQTQPHARTHTRQWRGQWPQGTQSGSSWYPRWPRFTEFDTDSVSASLRRRLHRPSSKNIQIQILWLSLSLFCFVINTGVYVRTDTQAKSQVNTTQAAKLEKRIPETAVYLLS